MTDEGNARRPILKVCLIVLGVLVVAGSVAAYLVLRRAQVGPAEPGRERAGRRRAVLSRGRLTVVNSFCRRASAVAAPRYVVHLRSVGPEAAHLTGVTVNGYPLSIDELYADGLSHDPATPVSKVPKNGVSNARVLWYDIRPGIDQLGPAEHIEFVVQMATETRLPAELLFTDSGGNALSCHVPTDPPVLRITGTGWDDSRSCLYVYLENQGASQVELSSCVINAAPVEGERLSLVGFPIDPDAKGCVVVRNVTKETILRPCWLEIRGKGENECATALMRIAPGFEIGPETGTIRELGPYADSKHVAYVEDIDEAVKAWRRDDPGASVCALKCPAHRWGVMRAGALRLIRRRQSLRRRGCTAPLYSHVCRRHIAEFLPPLGAASEIIRVNPLAPIFSSWTPSRGTRTVPQEILALARAASEPGVVHAVVPLANERPYFVDRAATATEAELLLSYIVASGARGLLVRGGTLHAGAEVRNSAILETLDALSGLIDIAEPIEALKTTDPSVECSTLLLGDLGVLAVLVNSDTSWLTKGPTEVNKLPDYPQPAVVRPSSGGRVRIDRPKGLAFVGAWEVEKKDESGSVEHGSASCTGALYLRFDSVRTARYVLFLTEGGREVMGDRHGLRPVARMTGPSAKPPAEPVPGEPEREKPAKRTWTVPRGAVEKADVADLEELLAASRTKAAPAMMRAAARRIALKARKLIDAGEAGTDVLRAYGVLLRAREITGNLVQRRREFAEYLEKLAEARGNRAAVQRASDEGAKFRDKEEFAEAAEYFRMALERKPEDRETYASILFYYSHACRKVGDLKRAVMGFREVVDDYPDTGHGTEVRFELAHCYYAARLDEKAEKILDDLHADAEHPDTGARALELKIRYAHEHDRKRDAMLYILRLQREYPDSPRARRVEELRKELLDERLKELDGEM